MLARWVEGNAVASRLVREADVILALGTRLGFNSTFYSYDNINRDAKIIQIELEPTAIGRFFQLRLGFGPMLPAAALQLAAVSVQQARSAVDAWTAQFQDDRAAYRARSDADAVLDTAMIRHPYLFKTLRDVLPAEQHSPWCRDFVSAGH